MFRKKMIAFMSVALLAVAVLSATVVTETASINTSFTFSTSCFIGFSKVNVTDCGQLADQLKYKPGDVILCNFDPKANAYISDVFYAYCQAFSKSDLTVTIKADKKMTECNGSAKIPYTIVENKGWKTSTAKTFTKTEKGAGGTIRVALSQPIQIKVDSKDVAYGKSYSMNITLEVKANA